MWRTRAVRSLLVAEVAALQPEAAEGEADGDGDEAAAGLEALARARRRAWLVVALDWAAILALVLLGQAEGPLLVLSRSEQAVFTLALLVIAVHSGFRLGQLEKYGAVARACRELAERDPE